MRRDDKGILKFQIVNGLNLLGLAGMWLRHWQGRDPVMTTFHMTNLGLLGVTVGYGVVLGLPLLANRFATQHFNVRKMVYHLSLVWLGYLLIFLSVPHWYDHNPAVLPGIIFTVVGALMMDAPRNGALGIRVVWTFASATVWRKTNELAGWLLMGSGLLIFVTGALKTNWFIGVMTGTILIACAVPTVYAYWISHQPRVK